MKKKLDLNQQAKSIVEQATGETAPKKEPEKKKPFKKSSQINQAKIILQNPVYSYH